MNNEIIGIIAGALSCTTFLPQVIKTWKSKSIKDVSLTMFLIAAVSTTLWLVYGIRIHSISIIGTNIVVLFFSLLMLLLFFKNRKRGGRKEYSRFRNP
jgi:MtN3 and saliva related transmembrane protein